MAFRIPLHRRTKKEMDQAISDLEKRGFKLIMKEPVMNYGKHFEKDRHGKSEFIKTTESTAWRAVMVKE
ncbi:hypothetical protein [Pueribacillus sp. YX66]|uniref:hypothetical protein n=1 Tax=Pueribacillus sp. YX66 TaxID=3229242 RepID=UPI00358D5BC9